MSIITISRGSYSRGKEVAEKVAEALNYECLSRDIILEASEQFNIPEMKLKRALHDAPSVFDRFTYGKEKYLAFFRAALLNHVRSDNIVYHGLAGHFLLQQVPNVFKIRIIADIKDRVKEEMKRENISAADARYILKKDDDERRRWGFHLYAMDTWDSSLYDMVLHIKTMSVDDAVSVIVKTAALPCFQLTSSAKRILNDLALAAEVQAALFKEFPVADVRSKSGKISVLVKAPLEMEKEITSKVNAIAKTIHGVEEVTVEIVDTSTTAD
ncbi:MAG: AAA family ATPase [Dissulfurispiraceae bacterium]